jgi:NF-kappa-B inhibitor-like protein 2
LHEAANFGFAAVVKELLDHKAKINDRGGPICEGLTPLHDALTNGHFEVANILIQREADVLALDDKVRLPLLKKSLKKAQSIKTNFF